MERSNFPSIGKLHYVVVLLAVFSYRFYVLLNFGYVITDSDQVIMWLATVDYSQGIFHEPGFYGQAYNTMFEALLAVPLYKLGVPLYMALPTITTLLALFPFVFLSYLMFRNASKTLGLFVLAIPLFLPVEYDLITSLSRGFVTGIAINALGFFAIFEPRRNRSFFLFALFSILGFTANSNTVLLSIPIAVFLLVKNYKNINFYRYFMLGIVVGVIPYLLINFFYIVHPNYIVHSFDLFVSFDYLKQGFSNMDYLLNPVIPLFWRKGYFIVIISLIFSIYFFRKKNWAEFFAVFSFISFLIFSFSVSKIYESSDSVFFHGARMYLAVPVLLAFFLSFIRVEQRMFGNIIVVVAFIIMLIKVFSFKDTLQRIDKENHVVSVVKVQKLFEICNRLNSISKEHNVDLIVIKNHWHYDFYNYACALCTEDFPPTIRPSYERRTWRMIEEQNEIRNTLLIIDSRERLDQSHPKIKRMEKESTFFLLENNTKKTFELFEELGFKVREF